MEAGADMCAQSTHKIIGALTQCSLLQVKSKRIDVNRVHQVLSLLQTTSPSYILMASLDCSRRQIALEGKELLDKAIDLATYARDEINKIPGFYCFGKELLDKPGVYALDPTKITINCRNLGITGYDLDMLLCEKYHIQVELSDLYNVLAVGSFGDTQESIDALINALKEISNEHYGKGTKQNSFIDVPEIPENTAAPRKAFNGVKECVLLKDSIGKVSGEFLMAYPPGIPVLCPGEIITQEIIDYVEKLKETGLYVQGTEDPEVEYIKIVK